MQHIRVYSINYLMKQDATKEQIDFFKRAYTKD